jgi:hypothetical protein
MRFSHRTLILLAGFAWLAIGIMLLYLGLHFILETVRNPALSQVAGRFSVIQFVARLVPDRTQAIMLTIIFSLLIGYIKGKMALAKSVKRQIARIESLPNPASLKYLYSKGYYLLIACMILLGILLRFFPITLDTRGTIDTIIGSALINGAMLYYRAFTRYAYAKTEKNLRK